MKSRTIFLFGIILLSLAGCQERKKSKEITLDTNNSPISSPKRPHNQESNLSKYSNVFTIKSTQKKSHTLSIQNKHIDSNTINQKILILHISTSTNPLSLDQMESLSKLQTKYHNHLIILSLLTKDTKQPSSIEKLLKQHHINHFVSIDKTNEKIEQLLYKELQLNTKTLPLTIIYNKGAYYSHFESSTPLEMINYDIQQILK